ncbi:3'-5' exonuclease family protein [Verminephrobacter eiseniae]|uniref:hypothetical protein n=1 Tax=Verminephrobacter eiseniae TaxID=364317 RepID=UPI0038B398AA
MTALIFGTKTTGIHEPAIVQAAWLMVKDPFTLTVVDNFEQRYNPGKPIELGALATHHILDEELADCPPASAFSLPPGTEYLIGHDVDYLAGDRRTARQAHLHTGAGARALAPRAGAPALPTGASRWPGMPTTAPSLPSMTAASGCFAPAWPMCSTTR